jgi:hypothetical protein
MEQPKDDVLADLRAAIERIEQQSREVYPPIDYSEGLRQLAEEFAARHGFTPPPRPTRSRTPELAPVLRFAIESGIMSEGQARDLDAFGDGIDARLRAGELTEEQAQALTEATAIRDAQAVNRARAPGNRAARRAGAAQNRRRR